MNELVLGCTVRDKISGFKGTVTGMVQYITGCNQVLITPKSKDENNYPQSQWIDEQRLDVVSGEEIVVLDNGNNPGCMDTPPVR